MDDLPGLLARDFGFRQQGKSAPMAPPAGSGRAHSGSSFGDVFGGPPRFSQPRSPPTVESFSATSKASSLPVYDKPVYDDDVFDGIPGMKSSTSGRHDDVFASMGSSGASAPPMGDFLESLGRSPSEAKGSGRGRFGASKKEGLAGFEGLIPGFVGSSPTQRSKSPETNYQSTSVPPSKSTSNVTNDPFVVLETSTSANSSSGLFTDPLEQISRPMSSGSTNINASPISGRLFDDIDGFGGLKKSTPSFSSEKKENGQDESPLSTVQNAGHQDPFTDLEPHTKSSTKTSKNVPKMRPTNGYQGTNHTFFQKPSKAADSFEDISRSAFSSSEAKLKPHERNATADLSPKLNENLEAADDVWLAVSEIPLFTQPTTAPSPSRLPPPLVIKLSSSGRTSRGASVGINFKGKGSSSCNQSSQSYENSTQNAGASPIDELEDFAMGRTQACANENSEFLHNEDNFERSSAATASAAVMKEAMDKAEAKFKHAKDARERERDAKLAKNREASQQERLYREKEQRDREEKEREEKRFERERELELERARERERERQVVGRVNRETRERAASEALSKFERAAFQRAAAEARERAERAAVEKTSAQVRERNAAQVQERHAAQVRERGASQAQEKQQNNENDLESIFGMKQRATTVENFFDSQVQSKPASDATRRSSSTSSSTIRKASPTTNIADDLTSVFGAPPSSGEFQVEGESEERRMARMERHLRTRDRATKALAEMNERDVQTKWEQEERLRIAETLDSEIKRWAAGKEGNLRALLSTLQYVLWPECGWQPASLTDLITSASVKKVYRKATLCIHPDKVQQKGANLQQKYIAEKVFDLLKEAWSKFNAEELF